MGRYADHVSISYVYCTNVFSFFGGLENLCWFTWNKKTKRKLFFHDHPRLFFCQPRKHVPKEFVPLSKHISTILITCFATKLKKKRAIVCFVPKRVFNVVSNELTKFSKIIRKKMQNLQNFVIRNKIVK